MVSTGAVADVAWFAGQVDAHAVAADTRVGVTIFLHFHAIARVPHSPLNHHRHPPAVVIDELRRIHHVAPPKAKSRRLHQHRIAAAANIVDLRRVVVWIKHRIVGTVPLGDGGLAAACAGVGAMHPLGSLGHRHSARTTPCTRWRTARPPYLQLVCRPLSGTQRL